MNEEYKALIDSPRVSPQTRRALLARLEPDDPAYEPQALTPDQLRTLRSILARVLPQSAHNNPDNEPIIDLAARLDAQLATGKSDGWRYASLPSDIDACRAGLRLLDESAQDLSAPSFALLSPELQDELLDAIASGRLSSTELDLMRWFEDLRANAAQIYVSHPQTLARMGYSGIADQPNGFIQLGIGQVESWEPSQP